MAKRAVAMVEEGESRREVARVLNLAPSTGVRWLDRCENPAPGTAARLSKHCQQWPLNQAAKEPALTLEELCREKKLAVATSSRFRSAPHQSNRGCSTPSARPVRVRHDGRLPRNGPRGTVSQRHC
jgi:hypothetical protein